MDQFDGQLFEELEEGDEIIDEDFDFSNYDVADDGSYIMNVKVVRTLENRKYPLTKYEMSKAITIRATILDKVLAAVVEQPSNVNAEVAKLEV